MDQPNSVQESTEINISNTDDRSKENPPPRIELKPYIRGKVIDLHRLIVTVGLLAMLAWVIVWASFGSKSWPDRWNQTKEMLQIILPALTGLIGSVLGFYFGSKGDTPHQL